MYGRLAEGTSYDGGDPGGPVVVSNPTEALVRDLVFSHYVWDYCYQDDPSRRARDLEWEG
jgi:hypothetical protein